MKALQAISPFMSTAGQALAGPDWLWGVIWLAMGKLVTRH